LVIVFDYPSNVSNCARRHPKDHLYFQPYTKIQQLSFLIAKDAALPIIICSAIDERGKGYEAGASAYLVKPVSPQQLTGEVAQWVEGQSRASVTS